MKIPTRYILVSSLSLLVLSTASKALFFANICIVSGTINLQGHPADKGLNISAYIADDKVAESTTKDNGSFELRIPEFDPAKPDVKGYKSPNDVVQVKLDGKPAKPTFNPVTENLKIDLRVEQTLDVKLSTWGKIKALFK